MQNEHYTTWRPLDGLPPRVSCEALHDDYEGFRILLKGYPIFPDDDFTTAIFRITFDPPLAYRSSDADDRHLTRNVASFDDGAALFIVEDSRWTEWFVEEAGGVWAHENITHYAIRSENDWIDVLSAVEPTVDWLTTPAKDSI